MSELSYLKLLLTPLFAGCSLLAIVYFSARILNRTLTQNTGAKRIASTTGNETTRSFASFASPTHKLQLVLLKFGIQSKPNPTGILWGLRVIVALPLFILFNLFLFNIWVLNAGLALVASYYLTKTFIAMTWMKTIEELEDDVLTFNASIRNTFKVIPDIASAVAFECELFEPASPLRQWMEQYFLKAAKSSTGLGPSFRQLKDEAYTISRSLYNCVTLLENVGETGGSQLDEAYLQTEEDLNIKARIRDQVQQVMTGTRSQKMILIAITIALMVGLGRGEMVQASGFALQILYIFILGLMMVGWNVITDMIERTLG